MIKSSSFRSIPMCMLLVLLFASKIAYVHYSKLCLVSDFSFFDQLGRVIICGDCTGLFK